MKENSTNWNRAGTVDNDKGESSSKKNEQRKLKPCGNGSGGQNKSASWILSQICQSHPFYNQPFKALCVNHSPFRNSTANFLLPPHLQVCTCNFYSQNATLPALR